MKRAGLLVAVLFAVSLTMQVSAQRAIKNGFSIQANFGFPGEKYGWVDEVADMDGADLSSYSYTTSIGFQLGNRWYIAPQEKWGVGIMVNWLDFNFAVASGTEAGYEWTRTTMDFTFVEFGPVGTFALNPDMAIDGYVNYRPTLLFSAFVYDDDYYSDNVDASIGFGGTYTLGAAFRWKVLSVGLEYVGGKVSSAYSSDYGDETYDDFPKYDVYSNNVRLVLGVKF